jgi:hypothetical protein
MIEEPRLARRGVLTLAALAAVPAACSRPAPPPGPVATAPPAAPVATAVAAPGPRSPSASATPSATSAPPPRKTAAAARRGGPVPVAGQAMLGSYLDLGGSSLRESLALRRRQLGRDQRILHLFHAWSEPMPRSVPELGKSTLLLSWHGVRYAGITNGSQDRLIAAAARRLAGFGRPMLLRWAWEMNGDWFEWGGANNGRDPAAYVSAYRRIHRIFADEGAGNVAWVWSPNWNSGPDESWNRMERYYPGDAYVDWVGVSGYNFYRESPSTLFRHVVSAYGKRKPIIVTETAAIEHGGRSKADWITALSAYVRRTPSIGGVVWFDTDVQHDSEHNFRFDSTAGALAAYRDMARSARFSG